MKAIPPVLFAEICPGDGDIGPIGLAKAEPGNCRSRNGDNPEPKCDSRAPGRQGQDVCSHSGHLLEHAQRIFLREQLSIGNRTAGRNQTTDHCRLSWGNSLHDASSDLVCMGSRCSSCTLCTWCTRISFTRPTTLAAETAVRTWLEQRQHPVVPSDFVDPVAHRMVEHDSMTGRSAIC